MTESKHPKHPIQQWRQRQTPPMTLQALAEKVDSTKVSMWRIENYQQQPRAGLARRLATVTGIPVMEILAAQFEEEPAR